MATISSKEAVVIVLDVGIGMTSVLSNNNNNETSPIEDALRSVTLLYQQKLIYSKKDELGLVLIGTKGTKNNLQDDGYQHITVASDIEEPSIETLKYLENLGPGESKGDVIDSLIVAMDMLIKRTENKKYQKRIFLVTNAKDPINTDDLTIVKDQFKKIDVKLNIIGVDFTDEEELKKINNKNFTNKQKNEIFLREFADSVDGVLVPVKQALEMMSFFRSQSVLQRTSFRGALEISPELKIPVWGFLKMKQQNLPTLKKISVLAQEKIPTPTTLDVTQETFFYSITDPDQEISKDDLLKGYKYGKSLIPFSKIDESQLKYSSASRCLKVLGFVDRDSIPLYYNMGCSEMFVAAPKDKQAEQSLSAFIRGMIETNQAMLVRYVKTMGSAPYLGYMIPKIKSYNDDDENDGIEEKFIECLYFNHLPLADDIRQYQFPSLSLKNPLTRKSFIPNKEQLDATQQLIDSMDLMGGGGDGDEEESIQMLKPSFTYNPLLQHFYQCLHHRSLHPNSLIPKLDPIISQYINPDEQILEKSKNSIKEFYLKFPLTKSINFNKLNNNNNQQQQQQQQSLKYYWKDGVLIGEEINLDSYVTDDGSEFKKRKINDFSEFSLNKLISGYVNEVGTINPVQNFKDMLNRRDVDLVDKAITLMKERIIQLVNDSLKEQYYQKAFECIKELRNGCIRESEADSFNSFIKDIRSLYENKKKDDFWKYITTNQPYAINLISEDECDSSSISKDEANEFLNRKQSNTQTPQINTNTNTDSVDDLFDQIE
ncbi:hypothetical protein DICPUDRAFT_158675 [Dictyostelium purpureum]|uniref:VWFA domain-containing protein n=1 Tax=Dictyostelium purpureum TaxID=5786 RepID=F1A270_DICPU|nr:uncharacterized protein DICPUDRAFT_158675 [Dictyostelium purpureum]EGC29713.1 hypothetical protein DICPUDRAFT_158675 [Dictyostelium purpureum]|eukprot:XP_003293765.1 hypothetical protein DICPUDRAFT_158675 [Dictyostelium purpureum]